MTGEKPTAEEPARLMLAYYQAHPYRGLLHLVLVAVTGGLWTGWFIATWFWIFVGWSDVEKLRGLRAS